MILGEIVNRHEVVARIREVEPLRAETLVRSDAHQAAAVAEVPARDDTALCK